MARTDYDETVCCTLVLVFRLTADVSRHQIYWLAIYLLGESKHQRHTYAVSNKEFNQRSANGIGTAAGLRWMKFAARYGIDLESLVFVPYKRGLLVLHL
jgi:hypothetical protein